MKNLKKITFLFLFLIISKFGFVQNQIDGTVRSVVELGLFKYCIIQQDGTNNYYKSSTYSSNIKLNQELKIDTIHRKDNRVVLIIPDVQEVVLGQKLGSSVNTYLMTKIGSELPICIDGTLFFTDTTHLRVFIDLVSNEYLLDDDDSEVRSLKLDSIQNLFPIFISYKNYFNAKYDYENGEFTEKEIEDMNKEDFINDDVIKSIFNEFKFIGVGDSIYYYHSIDEIISFHSEDEDAYKATKRISQLENAIDYDVFGINSEFFKNEGQYNVSSTKKKKNKPKGIASLPSNQYVNFQTIPKLTHFVEDCSRKRGLSFELWKSYIYYDNGDCKFGCNVNETFLGTNQKITINWGDGTTQVINNYNGNLNTTNTIVHEYLTAGNFNVTSILEFDVYGEHVEILDGFTPSDRITFNTNIVCAELNKEVYGWGGNGNWRLVAECWANSNFTGSWIGSKTESWERQNNGNYKKSRARIYTQVEGDFLDNNCVLREHAEDDKERSNDKDVSVREYNIHKRSKITNGDLKSSHFLKKGNNNLHLNLILNPCP